MRFPLTLLSIPSHHEILSSIGNHHPMAYVCKRSNWNIQHMSYLCISHHSRLLWPSTYVLYHTYLHCCHVTAFRGYSLRNRVSDHKSWIPCLLFSHYIHTLSFPQLRCRLCQNISSCRGCQPAFGGCLYHSWLNSTYKLHNSIDSKLSRYQDCDACI